MSEIKLDPQGKAVFITGSNRGIGKSLAIEFLNQGASKVYAGARDISTLDALKDQFDGKLIPVQLDVTDTNSIDAAVKQAQDVDILINNAGILTYGGFLNTEAIDSLNEHFKVNVWGLLNVTNAFINVLKSRPAAAIVNLGSLVSLASMPVIGTYSTSKAAVHSITQGIRGELASDQILVTGVYPGPIDTDMAVGFEMDKDSPENVAKNIIEGLAQGKEDIYPDTMSNQVGPNFEKSPKSVEKEFASYR